MKRRLTKKSEPKMISRHIHEKTVKMLQEMSAESKRSYEEAIKDLNDRIDYFKKDKEYYQQQLNNLTNRVSERKQEINKLTRVISNLHEVISVLGEELTEKPYTNPPYQILNCSSPNNASIFPEFRFKGANFLTDEHLSKNFVEEAAGYEEEKGIGIKTNVEAKIRKRRTNKSSTKKSN